MSWIWMLQWVKAKAEERRAQPPGSGDVPEDDGRQSAEHEDDGTIEPFARRWRKRKEEPGPIGGQ